MVLFHNGVVFIVLSAEFVIFGVKTFFFKLEYKFAEPRDYTDYTHGFNTRVLCIRSAPFAAYRVFISRTRGGEIRVIRRENNKRVKIAIFLYSLSRREPVHVVM